MSFCHDCSDRGYDMCFCKPIKQPNIKFVSEIDTIKKLQEENKILREALEFYANGIVQKDDYSEHKSVSTFSFTGLNRKSSGYGETEFVEQRFGKRAREALAKVDQSTEIGS